MTCSGRSNCSRASSVSSVTNSSIPLTSACSSRFTTGQLAPCLILGLLRARLALEASGDLEQSLGGVRTAIQDHIFDTLAQFRIDVLVDRQLARH